MNILYNIPESVLEKIKKIKVIVADCDGVLTDGGVFINQSGGDEFVRFNILDGMAVTLARDNNIEIIVLSRRKSLASEARFKNLQIKYAYTGVLDKLAKLNEILNELKVNYDEVAYIGDDLYDLKIMNQVGFKVCPPNAAAFVKKNVDYITSLSGGNGAFRELVEIILGTKDEYQQYLDKYL
ncbi:MAG: HAD hydrolase family protein [Burkholderiales bacterium]|nr:HAD hydrolase family protein [Burkholderiales bacterium]